MLRILTRILLKIYTLANIFGRHSIGILTEKDLIKSQSAPRDELGVRL